MNQKNINLFSRQEYFDKVFRRSRSYNSLNGAKTAINHLDRFCIATYQKETDDMLIDIRELMQNNPNDVTPMIFLDKFSSYLQNMKKSTSLIKSAINFSKKYMRQCGGIRVSAEDMQDYVTVPVDEEGDEELEPVTHDELRQIMDNTPNQRRKALYMVLKDSGCRISEALQLQKKFFDLSKNPATVFLPKRITKGKRRKRTQRLSSETIKILKPVLSKLNDEDYLSQSNNGNVKHAYKTERDAFVRVIERVGLTEKYEHNRRYKKNIHSIRSFCYTQSKLATGDADYAHGYIGHDKYLAVYERIEENEKDELFNGCAPRLSLYEDVVVVENDELKEKYEQRIAEIEKKFEDYKKEVNEQIGIYKKDPKKLLLDTRN